MEDYHEIFKLWKELCTEAKKRSEKGGCEKCPLRYCYFCNGRGAPKDINDFDIRVLIVTLKTMKAGLPVFGEDHNE